MPNPNLSDDQISAVIAFLTWVSNIDNQNWPPRPILVTAASPQGIVLGTPAPGAASADPVALGEAVFKRTPPACFGCHALQQGVTLVGPSMAGLVTRTNAVLEVPTTKAQRKRRRTTSGSRSSTRMATSCRGRPSRWAGNRSCRPSLPF